MDLIRYRYRYQRYALRVHLNSAMHLLCEPKQQQKSSKRSKVNMKITLFMHTKGNRLMAYRIISLSRCVRRLVCGRGTNERKTQKESHSNRAILLLCRISSRLSATLFLLFILSLCVRVRFSPFLSPLIRWTTLPKMLTLFDLRCLYLVGFRVSVWERARALSFGSF